MAVVTNLGNNANVVTFNTVDTLNGGTSTDTIQFTGTLSNSAIDLGTGADTLTLANGSNTVTVSNVETLTGGSGADTIILGGKLDHAVFGEMTHIADMEVCGVSMVFLGVLPGGRGFFV